MKCFLTFFACVAFASVYAQEPAIVPKPTRLETRPGTFTITPSTAIVLAETGLEKPAQFLNDYLQKMYGFRLAIQKNTSAHKNNIVLDIEQIDHPVPGAYAMTVSEKGIEIGGIGGAGGAGAFYGVQTLIQLLPMEAGKNLAVPYVQIEDKPRFAYRGMHLDVSRHYFPVSFIKKYIDYLALYKLNTFHWHLTDDQGWRIEIKKYPKLTQVGGFRNGTIIGHHPGKGNDNTREGGFYTQEQVKEIVKYAADRYITVIPEIEMPGHASAAIAAYPQLSCFPEEATPRAKGVTWHGDTTGKQVQQSWGVYDDVFAPTEYTFGFLQDVLDEVIPLFPAKYVHIGGDECPKTNWKRSGFCQRLIREKGLKDEHGLQSYFIQRMEKYLNSKGKQIIGWDEILEGGLAPNATVMSWRGEEGGIQAAQQNHDVIMTPGGWMYFDHSQDKSEDSVTIGGYLPIQRVYSYEPIPAQLSAAEARHVLGAQANLWSEYIAFPSKAEYMIFPRISALSEVLWSGKEQRNWNDFEKRLQNEFKKYEWWKVSFSKAFFEPGNK